jgi:hypothetical protein
MKNKQEESCVVNPNGRIYPPEVMEKAFADFIEKTIANKNYYGELSHGNDIEVIPEINIQLESKNVESKIIYMPWIIINPPYMLVSGYGQKTRRVWTKSKKKIILYYLYRITHIKYFLTQYNKN